MIQFNKGKNTAEELLNNFNPHTYAKTRNHIEGAVSLMSPYITHGILTLPEIYGFLNSNFNLKKDHKFFKELAWREFFYHVWSFKKNKIFEAIKSDFNSKKYDSSELPEDIRNASTGLPLIDNIVEQLYEYGYLHNHARMWIASYIIHFRKIDWRLGADWMYSHLLDGDLGSNHLSWQWIAGSFSSKPYLFNADNVSKYAPSEWNCSGTLLDNSYEHLYHFANGFKKMKGGHVKKEIEPQLYSCPIERLSIGTSDNLKDVRIIHPWNIRKNSHENVQKGRTVGVFFEEFHIKWPWSKKRWQFVMNNMKLLCDEIYWCQNSSLINNSHIEENLHIDFVFKNQSNKLLPEKRPNIWPKQVNYHPSFSKFWKIINLNKKDQQELTF